MEAAEQLKPDESFPRPKRPLVYWLVIGYLSLPFLQLLILFYGMAQRIDFFAHIDRSLAFYYIFLAPMPLLLWSLVGIALFRLSRLCLPLAVTAFVAQLITRIFLRSYFENTGEDLFTFLRTASVLTYIDWAIMLAIINYCKRLSRSVSTATIVPETKER